MNNSFINDIFINSTFTVFTILLVIAIAILIVYFTERRAAKTMSKNELFMLTMYQYSEIVVGTTLFFAFYILFTFCSKGTYEIFTSLFMGLSFGLMVTIVNMVNNWVYYNYSSSVIGPKTGLMIKLEDINISKIDN